jgi:hypothetical protein
MVMHKCIPPYKRGQNLSETHLLPHLEIVEREREREGERERALFGHSISPFTTS